MGQDLRVRQVFELHRSTLINVNYYGSRVTYYTEYSRLWLILAALASSGVIALISSDNALWRNTIAAIAATASTVSAVFNFSESAARAERLRTAYTMVFHSLDSLAKQSIGGSSLSPEQESILVVLEAQYAALAMQDEVDPDREVMTKAQRMAEQQYPDSYYYP